MPYDTSVDQLLIAYGGLLQLGMPAAERVRYDPDDYV